MKRILSLSLILALTFTMLCVMAAPTVQADTLWGIDVSQWQGSINWNQVKAAGVDFVILRGWCYGKDSNFESYYAGAKAAGIPVGVYVYTYGLNESAIVGEINSLINNCLKGKQFEFPIYVDMECTSYQGNSGWVNGYDINSKATNANLMDAACRTLENAGYYAGMYTYTSFIQSYLDVSWLKDKYTMWIADYRATCGYNGPYDMWQYSSTGRVNGISGDVDMNYCYFNFEPIVKSKGFNGYEPSVTYPYKTDDGATMLYDGEFTYTISTGYGTNVSTVTEHTEGKKSLKMTCTTPNTQYNSSRVGGMAHQILTQKADLSSYDIIGFDLYLPQKMSGSHGFQLNVNTAGEDGFNKLVALNDKGPGWVKFEIKKSDFDNVNGASWSNINRLRMTWFNYAGWTNTTEFYIDNIRAYNAPPAVDQAVENVKAQIQALPQPRDIRTQHETEVKSAQTAFLALNSQQQTAVGTELTQKLNDCLAALDKAFKDQQAIDRVMQEIEKLPHPGDVKHDQRDFIYDVRDLYEQLTEEQRGQVSNSQKLADVLVAYESLPVVMYGDADVNGVISAADALEVLKSVVGKVNFTQQQTLNGDVDGNSMITAGDALEILKKVVGKIEKFPVELA
ncbi:MAG: hypothetical protein IKU10_07235 [Clostridia bacterium]|nr:hypothetical protein [Clostridia bacterium]